MGEVPPLNGTMSSCSPCMISTGMGVVGGVSPPNIAPETTAMAAIREVRAAPRR